MAEKQTRNAAAQADASKKGGRHRTSEKAALAGTGARAPKKPSGKLEKTSEGAPSSAGREQRVRDRAYAIWERQGRPAGREREHWEQADREEP